MVALLRHKVIDLAHLYLPSVRTVFLELIKFAGVLLITLMAGTVFINAQVYYTRFTEDVLGQTKTYAKDLDIPQTQTVAVQQANSAVYAQLSSNDNTSALLASLGNTTVQKSDIAYERNLDDYLQNKKQNYSADFNLLPPDNRIFIPELDVDAPIQDLSYASYDKLEKGDFDKELFQGVVKYPSTPSPDQTGNMLIFGHTSYYRWENNPYGTIFSKIPKLKN